MAAEIMGLLAYEPTSTWSPTIKPFEGSFKIFVFLTMQVTCADCELRAPGLLIATEALDQVAGEHAHKTAIPRCRTQSRGVVASVRKFTK